MNLRRICGVVLAFATASAGHAYASEQAFKLIHVADLAAMMKSAPDSLAIYDANTQSTRSTVGVIPGAKLLSSSGSFNVKKELPKNKETTLVFYCANTQCTASHSAANRAIQSGYGNVSVMADGIYGWKKAGEPVQVLSKTPVSLQPKAVSELTELHAAVIVDVREGEERHEIIHSAAWMPMSEAGNPKAWSRFELKLPKDKTIVFHCESGTRAKRAAEKLAGDGYKTAYFEGPDQWKNAGLPLEKGPAQ